MTEPTTNPASQATPNVAAPPATGARQLDHNDKCVGCGAPRSAPCTFDCFFETGILDAAAVLRAAAHRLVEHPDGGIDIRAAITTAVAELTGEPAQDRPVRAARTALADYLEESAESAGARFTRHALLLRLARRSNRNQVAVTMYAAAAEHDGIEFDPDAFGDFLAWPGREGTPSS
jgi:hypothetical protein